MTRFIVVLGGLYLLSIIAVTAYYVGYTYGIELETKGYLEQPKQHR